MNDFHGLQKRKGYKKEWGLGPGFSGDDQLRERGIFPSGNLREEKFNKSHGNCQNLQNLQKKNG